MNKLLLMLFVFATLYAIILLITLLLPHYFVSELVLSFIPYHGLLLFLVLLGLLIQLVIHRKQKHKHKHKIYNTYKTTSIVKIIAISTKITSIALICLLTLYTNRQWLSFYQHKDFASQSSFDKTQEEIGLTVMFGNILKFNTDYESLIASIQENNPDVVMFVEYKQHHHDNLQSFFAQEYPYVNRIIGEQDVVGNVIFSKVPLEDFAPKIYQGAWRYGYVSITHEQKTYYLYLVHTSAPVSQEAYDNRNQQIQLFLDNFIEHEQKRLPEGRVVIIGDFNVSPRTPTFKNFHEYISAIDSNMTHIATFMPLYMTRGLQRRGDQYIGFTQSLIRSHIDHVRFNNNTTLYSANTFPIQGSDHSGILVRIY